ncbi:MAG: M20/M25/M40 family metallo-hydrolase [Acholeplasmataceae bacterium]|nr:M20/M25/M40 family metallo-hydrolase [Acholeplasmataceae bacterium]
MILLYIFIAIVVVILMVVIGKTLAFQPKDFPEMKRKVEFDEKHAVETLSKMIQFKTISYANPDKIDLKAFESFRGYLRDRYPKINAIATYSEHEKGVLFRIKGERQEAPVVLMAHYDVVPVSGQWQDDPFSGRISETTVYGRGTLDTKNSLCCLMEAVEHALNNGKMFHNDLYLAFSGDEEINGPSAPAIVKHLKDQGVQPAFVLDEGGAIVSKMFPGVQKKAAVIGIAEKGYLNLKLIARSKGGHASTPPASTPLTELSEAIINLNQHPAFKLKLTPPVKAMFDTIAPHSKSFPIKMLFSNLWLFLPVVKWIAKKTGGEFLSLFKTTQAFTLAEGSEAINVLPSEASIGINYRLAPFESSETVLKRIRKIINNNHVDIEIISVSEPTTTSVVDDLYQKIRKSIKQTWPDVVCTPYLMVATTDSRHYHDISNHVFKFSPMDVSKADLAKIHGVDEDITIDNVIHGVRFYLNLIDQL